MFERPTLLCVMLTMCCAPVLADESAEVVDEPLAPGMVEGDRGGASADKSQYTIFNPTPKSLWRAMSADRPDFTESPITVDAGAVQLEMSFVDYAKSGSSHTWTVAPVNLKIGLLNNVDIQFVYDPYAQVNDEGESDSGWGTDLQIRTKINLWGNDGGDTALALMPFLQIPTGADDTKKVEGGLIVPWGTDLTDTIGLGLMFESDFVYDDVADGYEVDLVFTGVIGFDVTEAAAMYVEGIAIESTNSSVDFRGILGVGATYSLSENVVLDIGCNLGLAGEVDDVNVFTGITWRF